MMEYESTYQIFDLLSPEFTFGVDVSDLPCGRNGALYLSLWTQMACPRDLKFINGQANVEGWESSSNDVNSGVAPLAMPPPAILMAAILTHIVWVTKSFYGPNKIVDTTSPFTAVTHFITDDGTSSGSLKEIKRFYVQNGKVIPHSKSTIKQN
ncbi:CAZyme family GH7 [Penicillium alfredii]|uniref:Glucanase n=1 Tax=Penicillium alfredii TaxID=1506179 RepID=A0A9W9FLM1_9EURO|nr:CAZyme family GH7 [Penicillium alfredii]KAJ5102423.1 CAZyme family GH7 [Penicillium alfredii]